MDLPNVTWVSLQKGSQVAEALAGKAIQDRGSQLTDFAQTAEIIAQLDLIITVDTAVAHLAGAMGKAVWLLLPYNPDWRWMRERTDSPWYPTMRLFRQTQPGNWETVFQQVRNCLLTQLQPLGIAEPQALAEVSQQLALAQQHHLSGRLEQAIGTLSTDY
uniref:Glycosyltransferase family 9 protein n=1 Tax=Desertifilum tharense IPPAS B-1220 TaxID=1781255 RepID=A0ACD5GT06_9CYAN